MAAEIFDPSGVWRQCMEPDQLLPVAGGYEGAIACPPEANALCGNMPMQPPSGDTSPSPLGDTPPPPPGGIAKPDTTPMLGDTPFFQLGETTPLDV